MGPPHPLIARHCNDFGVILPPRTIRSAPIRSCTLYPRRGKAGAALLEVTRDGAYHPHFHVPLMVPLEYFEPGFLLYIGSPNSA